MRESITSNTKCYGAKVNKTDNKINYLEEYVNNNFFLTLPLGELLFSTLEFLDSLSEADEVISDEMIQEFFSGREFNLSSLFFEFKPYNIEFKKLIHIKEYLDLCVNNKRFFTIENLKGVALKLLEHNSPLFRLFDNKTSKYYIRRIISDCDIPFGYTTEGIANVLSSEYNEFSFYTRTQIYTLPELCLLSVFEIIESGQIVQRCVKCKQYFISKRNKELCDRPSEINDFRGCKNYELYLYQKQYKDDEVVKEYFRIYNKLQIRAKSKKYFDIMFFDDFKKGWNKLKKANKEEKIKFLSMERWK